MLEKLLPIIQRFQIEGQASHIAPIEIGHINETYKLTLKNRESDNDFVLQKINTQIFKSPQDVMENITKVGQFLKEKNYPKEILMPIQSVDNQYFIKYKTDYWRLFPFIKNTQTFNEVDTTEKAYQAAFAFGEYGRYLNDFDATALKETIPDFHNTNLRYQQFFEWTKKVKGTRKKKAQKSIDQLFKYRYLVSVIKDIKLPLRVAHNDTKINNILFDKTTQQPVCVIDLDTLMPGTILYDFGDMVRTFTPSLEENSADYDQIFVRKNILKALTEGYIAGWNEELNYLETKLLHYGAQLTIFEQALRFLTDYLAGDPYYKVAYAEHNLVRAKNQICLLDSLVSL